LVSGAFNKITVVATDASINANKDTMSFSSGMTLP